MTTTNGPDRRAPAESSGTARSECRRDAARGRPALAAGALTATAARPAGRAPLSGHARVRDGPGRRRRAQRLRLERPGRPDAVDVVGAAAAVGHPRPGPPALRHRHAHLPAAPGHRERLVVREVRHGREHHGLPGVGQRRRHVVAAGGGRLVGRRPHAQACALPRHEDTVRAAGGAVRRGRRRCDRQRARLRRHRRPAEITPAGTWSRLFVCERAITVVSGRRRPPARETAENVA